MSGSSAAGSGATRRRSGGRAARKKARQERRVPRAPYLIRRLGTFDVLDEEGLGLIEHNADRLLQETGMEFRDDPEVLEIFRAAGAAAVAACGRTAAAASWRRFIRNGLAACESRLIDALARFRLHAVSDTATGRPINVALVGQR